MELAHEQKLGRIRELNDAFRMTFAGGTMVMTASVAAQPEMVKSSALTKVADKTTHVGMLMLSEDY